MKKGFFKQKINLYFDENFDLRVVKSLKSDRWFRKKCRITSVFERDVKGREDRLHFDFCKQAGFCLVTIDGDFWNDKKYPFSRIPGIIILKAAGKNIVEVKRLLEIFVSFFSMFPQPKFFVGDSKFKVSGKGCLMKGLDSVSRSKKTFFITRGNSVAEVGRKFSWFY